MKESKYNFFVPHNERTICFNAISGKIFSVSKNEYKSITDFLENPHEGYKYADFFKRHNFVVNDEANEFDSLLFKNREAILNDTFHLIINPTLQCNFDCWYCYEKHTIGHMSSQTIDNVKLLLKKQVEENKISGLILSWFGGEPLLCFHNVMYPISTYAKELMQENNLSFSNSVTTNGYCIDRKMIETFGEIKLFTFQITLDGDKESHDKTRNQKGEPSFKRIISNIIDLCSLNPETSVVLRINYTNEIISKDYKSILNAFPQSIRKNISVDFQRVWQTYDEIDKSNIENKQLKETVCEVRELGFDTPLAGTYTIFKYNQCYADKYNFAHINFDGKVYKCTARDYSEKYVCGELNAKGEIEWRNEEDRKNIHDKSLFDNDKCRECKVLPLCVGPCSQTYLEYKNNERTDFCPQEYKEINVDTFIQEYYLRVKNQHLLKKDNSQGV
jgi:uncharacterized protein